MENIYPCASSIEPIFAVAAGPDLKAVTLLLYMAFQLIFQL